jgi:hypothetical protein
MARPRTDDDDDAAADYDVMAAEPMGDDDPGDDESGEDWDANEMARGQGEDEAEPLEADEEDDDEEELEASEEDQEDDEEVPDDEEDDEDDDEDDDEELEAIEPPSNWPEQEREFFGELPPELQHAYMSRAQHMTADYTRKTQALAQERQQIAGLRQTFGELERTIAPHVQQWALNGMAPAQAVSQLIALSDFATRDPREFIKYFAGIRGVDLQQLGDPQNQEYVDPQVSTLRQQLSQVQAHLNQSTQQQQQWQQAQYAQQYQTAFNTTNAAIDEFARQTDQAGNSLYPFFDTVIDDMAGLIETGQARSMPEAYRKAVWLNENTRTKMLARSRSEENAKAQRRAERAVRAASSLTGASGANGAFNPENMSIRDTINAAWSGGL